MRLLLPHGTYLEKCGQSMPQASLFGDPTPDPTEIYYIHDGRYEKILMVVNSTDLARCRFWPALKKDNALAYKKRIDRYYISRRKILSLRKNNPVKSTYKRIRATLPL